MPKRDSFLVIMDSLDLPKLGSKQKRVSQVFLSELLDLDGKSDFNKKVLQTSTKDPFLVSKNSSRKDPFILPNKSMRALTRTFSQSGNSRMRKIQRKNSF